MKSFRDYLNEEVLPSVQVADGGLDIDKPAVRAAINAAIAGVVSQPAVTPYVVFNRLSKLLAQYHIVLPKRFLEGDKGVEVFEIKQFGHRMGMTDGGEFVSHVPTTHYLFLQYGIITPFGVTYAKPVVGGMFRVMARLVDKAELDQLISMAEISLREEAEVRQNAAKAMAPKEEMHTALGDCGCNQGKSPSTKSAIATSQRKNDKKLSASSLEERYHVVTSKYSLEPGEVGKRTSEDEVHSKHKSLKAAARKLTTVIGNKKDAQKYEILDTETGKRMSRNQARDLAEEQLDELEKSTYASYIKKASHDVATKSAATGRYADRANRVSDEMKKGDYSNFPQGKRDSETADKFFAKSWKRRQGIAKAADKLAKESIEEAKMTRTQRNLAVRRFMAHDAEAGERILAQGKKDREEKKSFASAKKEISDLKKKNLEETNATNKSKKRDVEADIGARYKKMGFDGRGSAGRHPENKRNDDIGLGRKVLKRDPSNLEEKLTKSMSAGDVISDFAHSKAKTFKGDTKKERINRALGAYYGMHPEKSKKKVDEETKVSKYIPQAANSSAVTQALIQAAARRKKQADSANQKVTKEKTINELHGKGDIEKIASAHHKKAMAIRDKVSDSDNPHITAHQRAGVLKNMRDSSNRGAYKGMAKVARAQQKSREKLEEVSKETYASYIPKAAHSVGLIAAKRASKVGRDISHMDTPEYAKSEKKQMMRHRGIARATEKLAKEEVKFDPSTEIPKNS